MVGARVRAEGGDVVIFLVRVHVRVRVMVTGRMKVMLTMVGEERE